MEYWKDELYHYGVLGMKWGIRRYQPYSVKPRGSGKTGKEIGLARKAGNAVRTGSKKAATVIKTGSKKVGNAVTSPIKKAVANKKAEIKKEQDKSNAIEDRKKTVKDMRILSDAEIQNRINRLRNEQELKRLIEADVEPGKKFINSILTDSTKRVLTTAATGAMIYGVKWMVDQEFDKSEFARSIYKGGAPKK